jgi:hypothetical protein
MKRTISSCEINSEINSNRFAEQEIVGRAGTNLLKNEEPLILRLRRAMMNNWDERNVNYIEERGELQRELEEEMEIKEMNEERKVRKFVFKIERDN